MKGPLIILSGPSGCGKSTVTARVLARGDLRLRQSVSATTRPKRPAEEEGKHYHFWTRPHFDELVPLYPVAPGEFGRDDERLEMLAVAHDLDMLADEPRLDAPLDALRRDH